jgi:hypothetical protein
MNLFRPERTKRYTRWPRIAKAYLKEDIKTTPKAGFDARNLVSKAFSNELLLHRNDYCKDF